jgi:cell division protease FtsH
MVREWGMSDRIGPMAWGSQGAVFLGEDLMHTRDYSDETARVIDEEVERILRDEEDRCRKVLTEYRPGLDAVARALLERETLSGDEVGDTVDAAMGRKVGGPRLITRADGSEEEAEPMPSLNGDLEPGAIGSEATANGAGREPDPANPQHG